MALIICIECSKIISDNAATCPHCGAPTKYGQKQAKKARRIKKGNVQGVGCLLMMIVIILGLTVIGIPFAVFIFVAGLVVLVVGFFVR